MPSLLGHITSWLDKPPLSIQTMYRYAPLQLGIELCLVITTIISASFLFLRLAIAFILGFLRSHWIQVGLVYSMADEVELLMTYYRTDVHLN